MRVGLFVTCLVDLLRPSIAFASLKLLKSTGCNTVIPSSQTCCGQPAYNSGYRQAAIALAKKTLDEFKDCDYVVVPSGSCAGMIRVHYPELARSEPSLLAEAQNLSSKTYELTDFLVNVAKTEKLQCQFRGSVTYHDSCSGLRELGIKLQPRFLLAKNPSITLKEMKDCQTCCGFGGTFAVKYNNISAKIADDKCRNIQAMQADAVAMGDLGCMLHIEGRLRHQKDDKTKVMHIAELLAGEE